MDWKTVVIAITIFFINVTAVMADELRLKNGDHITGKVTNMENGKLIFKTSYAGEISIKWSEISNLTTDDPIKVVLSDETTLKGVTEGTEDGKIKLRLDKIAETVSFALSEVKSINPKPEISKPVVKLKGRVNVGLSATKGNTETEVQHLDAELVARTAENRYTIGTEFNRAQDKGEKTVDNALAYMKYDHFLDQKWFLYANTLFEGDEFKDLNLRTALGIGVGYQFWEKPLTNLSMEAGMTYVNEDLDDGEDNSYPAGRWAINFDKYVFEKTLQFFHFHEGFGGLEDTDDLFIRSRTGLRFPLYKNLKATAQYNYDWDNTPAPGQKKADEMYVLTLGYEW